MNANPDFFSPVPLSYIAALRGIRPRRPGDAFAYAEVILADAAHLVCLAASNPEGRFYGLAARADVKAEGERLTRERQVTNVTFLDGSLEDLAARAVRGDAALPSLHYLCCDERQVLLAPAARTALFAFAEKNLLPGGLLAYGYRAYDSEDGPLRFLVREFSPEMDAMQAKEFLGELKNLGAYYFAANPQVAARLEQAATANVPDQFFTEYDAAPVRSGSLDTMAALSPRGFAYAGDADIHLNYMEQAAPVSAHALIVESRGNIFYEPIKDFALNRQTRCDIWCRQPAQLSDSLAELFGAFVYGIVTPRHELPNHLKKEGSQVDLSAPLYAKLIDFMAVMPLSIGDFLAHPEGKNFAPAEVVGAVQVLVGFGLARPMRGHYRAAVASIAQPRLAGTFNQYLDKTTVTGAKIWLSSPVTGSAVSVSARDALVMQALNRAGLANSVSVLLPELERIAKDPASAASVMNTAVPTPELASNMIKDTVSQSIVQWYAYGLLAAA